MNIKQQTYEILQLLDESENRARIQIECAIKFLGFEKVSLYAHEAIHLYKEGNLKRRDGEKRTVGGVFFFLLRTHLDVQTKRKIFYRKKQPLKTVTTMIHNEICQSSGITDPKLLQLYHQREKLIQRIKSLEASNQNHAGLRTTQLLLAHTQSLIKSLE